MDKLKGKLEQKVSFDFAETPLRDVVTFLQEVTNATIFLDEKAMADLDDPLVTLKVNEMKLSQALDWILVSVDLKYALKDEAIFISTEEEVGGDAILKLYDVTDVILEIRDFPGNLAMLRDRVGTSSSTGGGGAGVDLGDQDWGPGWGEGDGGSKGGTFTADSLIKFIKDTIAPGTWQDVE